MIPWDIFFTFRYPSIFQFLFAVWGFFFIFRYFFLKTQILFDKKKKKKKKKKKTLIDFF
jgi:hypothetical protein